MRESVVRSLDGVDPSRPALTPDEFAEVLIGTIKAALAPRDAKIEALQQDVRALSDRVVELEAQAAARAGAPVDG